MSERTPHASRSQETSQSSILQNPAFRTAGKWAVGLAITGGLAAGGLEIKSNIDNSAREKVAARQALVVSGANELLAASVDRVDSPEAVLEVLDVSGPFVSSSKETKGNSGTYTTSVSFDLKDGTMSASLSYDPNKASQYADKSDSTARFALSAAALEKAKQCMADGTVTPAEFRKIAQLTDGPTSLSLSQGGNPDKKSFDDPSFHHMEFSRSTGGSFRQHSIGELPDSNLPNATVWAEALGGEINSMKKAN